MPTLYLHIGTHKTGTTAIRRFCDRNRAAMARRGVLYPILPYKYRGIPMRRNAYFLVAARQRPDGSFEDPRQGRIWHRRMARLARKFRKYPSIMLTDEIIWNTTSFGRSGFWINLKRASEELGFDVRFILYLRRQDQFMTSLWAQRVKSFSTRHGKMKWEELVDEPERWVELDYYGHLEEIAGHFGRDAIDVRVYDRSRFEGGDVIPDFLSALGLKMEPDYVTPEVDQNPSLSGNYLEIKRIINSVPHLTFAQRQRARRVVEACCAQDRQQERFSMFTDEELRAFLARYEEGNRKLSLEYLGGADESPFPPPEPQPPKWTPDNPRMHDAFAHFIEAYFSQHGSEYLIWLGDVISRNLKRLRWVLRERLRK